MIKLPPLPCALRIFCGALFLRAYLECVSKREIRKFEWIFRQFKE